MAKIKSGMKAPAYGSENISVKAAAKYSKSMAKAERQPKWRKRNGSWLKSISMAAMKISMAAKANQRKWP
jgi:hypothetical protein